MIGRLLRTQRRCYSKSTKDILETLTAASKKSSQTDYWAQLRKSTQDDRSTKKPFKPKTHPQAASHASQGAHTHYKKPQKKVNDPYAHFDPKTFKYSESLSLRENEYYTDLFKRVYEVNPQFQVLKVGDEGSPKKCHFKQVLKELQDDETVDIVDIQTVKDHKYPLLRLMNKESVLKTFAEKRSMEISKLYGRTREKKRDSNVKFVKVSWEISPMDLENQKCNEILSHLKKNYKLTIAIDSKDNFNDMRGAFDVSEALNVEKSKKLNDLEMIKREKTLTKLKDILADVAEVETSGNIGGRIVLTVIPMAKDSKNTDKKSSKDQKKLERILKQKQREEKKKAEMEARAKEFEKMQANTLS